MKLLYITRKYPPMVGGLEQMSYALAQEFPKHFDTTLITWGRSQKYLPYFLIVAFFQSLYVIVVKKVEHIHIGDGLLSPLGLLLKHLFGIRTTITIAGLDVTFNFPGYQLIVPRCIAQMDKVICISNATLQECIKRGIPKEKCVVIPCGVYPERFIVRVARDDLGTIAGQDVRGKKVLITVGRLVKRKGVYWFIKHVFPKLDKEYLYLIIGDGPERTRIYDLVVSLGLQARVLLLGKISDEKLKIIYNTADLFVMPNIKVDNNMEGFGIVAVEASAAGMPVIASDIEGISDAVIHDKTGVLLPEENPDEMIHAIKSIHLQRETIRTITAQYFSWQSIGKKYITVMTH